MIDLVINGEKISAEFVTVSKSITTSSGVFSFKIGGGKLKYKYRDTVEIFTGGVMILKGKIEHIKAIKDKSSDEISYSGRDSTGDFLDSYFDKTVEFNRSLNVKKIISDIAKPFGIEVISKVTVPNFTVGELPTAHVGQGIFDFCEKLCRIRSVLLTASNDGNLLITDEGLETNDTPIIFGDNFANAFERTYERDHTKEFNRYVVYSQNNSTLDNLNNLVNVKATLDDGVRVKTLIENNSLNVGECLERAKFERDLDIRKGLRYTAKIEGETKYYPNQKVSVKDQTLNLDEVMLIVSAQWVYSSKSEHVELTLEKIP